MATVLLARQLLTPLERIADAALVMEDGIIAAIGPREALAVPAAARTVDFGGSGMICGPAARM